MLYMQGEMFNWGLHKFCKWVGPWPWIFNVTIDICFTCTACEFEVWLRSDFCSEARHYWCGFHCVLPKAAKLVLTTLVWEFF